MLINLDSSRRTFLTKGGTLLIGGLSTPTLLTASSSDEDILLLHEVKLTQEMGVSTYKSLWDNLSGITEKEFDWRPNMESNSVRWVLGHLWWFEEWLGDALEKKGRYFTDKTGTSIQDQPVTEIKIRFDSARERVISLINKLTPEQLRSEINYVGRFDIQIRKVLQTHVLHMSGHRYQIRYIRGTFSRVFHTNKADFDPW